MRGFAKSGVQLSRAACAVAVAFVACGCGGSSEGPNEGPNEGPVHEVSQGLVGGCGYTNICTARNACQSWDLNWVGDGLGYNVAAPWSEPGMSWIRHCGDHSGCTEDPPSQAPVRRSELIAGRPGISVPASNGLIVNEECILTWFQEYGCGRYDQYCATDESFSCTLHISNYPTPMTGVHDWCSCAQYQPIACGANDAVVGGTAHTCALVGSGVRCWGSNSHGQLGNGSNVAKNVNRVPVTGLTSGVYTVASGGSHTCAIVGGAVKCWGFNNHGQLGNVVANESRVPVPVSNLSGVQAIVGGDLHTCAIAGNGAWCWGYNGTGQLGASSAPTESYVPIQVNGLTSGVTAITAGGSHSCAVVNGAAKCWGDNTVGQLGNGTADQAPPPPQSTTPVQVTGLSSGVQSVAAGLTHSCALVNGGVTCWGNNASGQLGNGTVDGPPPAQSFAPVQVTGLASGVQSIIAGRDHTCAFLTGGGVKCWGSNGSGQLGTGSFDSGSSPFPVSVTSLASGVQAIATGYQHSCALGTGGIQCWGSNGSGQLAVNTDDVGQSASPLAIGQFTCSVVSGSMQCSGM
jgi:alpha-tubulin suppressor-like RCC1 family protein